MPVTDPYTEAVNVTPTSVASVAPESTVAGPAKSKIVSSGVAPGEAAEGAPLPIVLEADTVKV